MVIDKCWSFPVIAVTSRSAWMFTEHCSGKARLSKQENRTNRNRDAGRWGLRSGRRSPALVGICPLGRRVRIQPAWNWQPSLPNHTKPYHTIPYQITPYHTKPFHTISYRPAWNWRLPGNGRPRHYHITCPATGWDPTLATTGMCPRQMMLFHSVTNIKLSKGDENLPASTSITPQTSYFYYFDENCIHSPNMPFFDFHNVLLVQYQRKKFLSKYLILRSALGRAHG